MNWRGVLIRTALLGAVATWAMGPGSAEARQKPKKQITRITQADRQAAADARRAQRAGARATGAKGAAAGASRSDPAGAGGSR